MTVPNTENTQQPDDTPDVYYRSQKEFDRDLYKIAERLHKARRRSPAFRFVSIAALTSVCLIGAGTFETVFGFWPSLLPFDSGFVTSAGIVLTVVFVYLYVRVVQTNIKHVVAQRTCFGCLRSLRNVAVDEPSDKGTCPQCQRVFCLGEYRRPSENCGAQFAGYKDEKHFKLRLRQTCENIQACSQSHSFERRVLDGIPILLITIFFVGDDLGIGKGGTIGGVPLLIMAFAGWALWCAWYWWRVERIHKHIIPNRLCLHCGYSLLNLPVDEVTHLIRCPECGQSVHLSEYDAPQKQATRESK